MLSNSSQEDCCQEDRMIAFEDGLRPIIRDAWERSKAYNVDRKMKKCSIKLSKENLEERSELNREWLTIGEVVIKRIFEFVKGSGFVVMLVDKDGYILSCIGDDHMMKRTNNVCARPGYCWSEKIMGANAIGTALAIGMPIQLNGNEHWCTYTQVGTCSAAPIFNPDTKEIIGVLNLTGMMENVHEHSLGMVVAGAGWVENEISTLRNAQKLFMVEAQKVNIIETVTNSIFALSNTNCIMYMNQRARRLFQVLQNVDPEGCQIEGIIDKHRNTGFLTLIRKKEYIKDEAATIWVGNRRIDLIVNIRNILGSEDKSSAVKVILLQEEERIRNIIKKISVGRATIHFSDLIGRSASFLKSVEKAKRVAQTTSNILIMGESGTGKDYLAQAIHNGSERTVHPFIAINCAAIPKELLASELFGYEEGAFTGARKGGSKGKFELASGGTLFLDEIGEMTLEMQASLLRVLEEKSIMRVGGQTAIPIDARIIAATHRKLKDMVDEKLFRLDLYYRLNVVSIKIPPLRERQEDIPLLVESLYQKTCTNIGILHNAGFSPEVMNLFMKYPWPGNIREVQNTIESAINMCVDNEMIKIDMLPEELVPVESIKGNHTKDSYQRLEKVLVYRYLEKYSGNKSLVARELGISRSTLYRLLK